MKNLLLAILLLSSFQVLAQPASDSLFQRARILAGEKRYPEAVEILEGLHSTYPENADFSTYLARVYFWSGRAEKSATILSGLKDVGAEKETLDLMIQVQLELRNTVACLTYIETGMTRFPEAKNQYLLWKATALEQADRNEEALEAISLIPVGAEEYDGAAYLKMLILRKKKNTLSAGYLVTFFDDPTFSALQLAHLEYARKFKKWTPVFRLNYADMFNKQRLQFETDAYVKTRRYDYLYLNAGIAEKNSVFPFLRFGAEYYSARKKVSFSAGARYLYFNDSSSTVLGTGHIAYQHKSWTFNYRFFVLFLPDETLSSHLLYIRKSIANKETYVQLDLQYGSLPYFFYTADILSRLSAYRVGFSASIRIRDDWFVQPIVLFEYEEFVPDVYRNRYTLQVILSRRF